MKSKMLGVLRRYISLSQEDFQSRNASSVSKYPDIAILWKKYWQGMNPIYSTDSEIRSLDLKSYLNHKGVSVVSLNSGYVFKLEKGQYAVRDYCGIAQIGVFVIDSVNPEGKIYCHLQFRMSSKAFYKKLVRFDEMWDIAHMKMSDVLFLVNREEMIDMIEETTRLAARRRN